MPFTSEYKKLKLIGRGSFAAVYKVRHKQLGYIRAIKISNEMVDSEQDKAYQSFLNECRLLLQIGNGSHPNIVHIYQPRLINGRALVEMDYIDGIALTDYIRGKQFVEMDEFWRFAKEILGAVGYCHEDLYEFLMDPDADNLESDPDNGQKYLITPEKRDELRAKYCVNHNDLHSHNIMRRNYDGSYILLDFGLAIQSDHCVKSSSRGAGAHEYSSPEKLSGQAITSESDVYSLGILMYEMLTGKVPFVLPNSGSIAEMSRLLDRHLHETPPPIGPQRKAAFEATHPGEEYVQDYPDELEAVVMKCLMKKPSDRFHTAKKALEAVNVAMAMSEKASDQTSATIDALKADLERLTNENEQLRLQLKELTDKQQSKNRHALYSIGQTVNGGRVCFVDSSGEHGLVVAKQSDRPLRRLRHIDEEYYDLFSYPSKIWYKENCFIIPRGTHLPTQNEMNDIAHNLKTIGFDSDVWTDAMTEGNVMPDGVENYYIAVKAF